MSTTPCLGDQLADIKMVIPKKNAYFEDYIDDGVVGTGPYKVACSSGTGTASGPRRGSASDHPRAFMAWASAHKSCR